MKEILLTILLGIIQGLTEFLPVSSSGHLALFQDLFNMNENPLFLTVALHFGTLLAVVVYYLKDLLALFKKENHKTVLYLIVATIPAGLIMLFSLDTITILFSSTKFLWVGFLLTAIILYTTEIIGKKQKNNAPTTIKTALIMGISQACAVFPGISRSGSTIAGGIILSGGKRKEIADFAFLMSIPVIAGSTLFEALTIDYKNINLWAVLLGTFASFLTGFFAIKFMLKLIKKCNFKWFSLYLIFIAILTFVNGIIIPIW